MSKSAGCTFVGLVDRLEAGLVAGLHQVAGDLGLAVDGHDLAGGRFHVDAMTRAAERQLDAVVDQAFAVQPLGDAGFVQKIDRALLQHPGANAAST